MTDYEALAQRAVRAGILDCDTSGPYEDYWIPMQDTGEGWAAEEACKDGRVILAAMEKVLTHGNRRITLVENVVKNYGCRVSAYFCSNDLPTYGHENDELAVAILTACLDALEGE